MAVVPLLWITAYVTIQGSRFLSIEFFTRLPTPVGVPGGGVINAIVGTGIVVAIACAIAIPIALVGAFFAADYPNTPPGIAVRFGTDVLSGIPSIVIGIFAYTVIVLPQRRFSAFAAGFALAIIMLETSDGAGVKMRVQNLDFYYGAFRAITDVTMDIPEHRITAIIGSSGCGKSTLLRTFNRIGDLVANTRVQGRVRTAPRPSSSPA